MKRWPHTATTVTAAGTVGILAATKPGAAIAGASLPLAITMLGWGKVLLTATSLGALFVFQVEAGIDARKLAWLVAFGSVVALGIVRRTGSTVDPALERASIIAVALFIPAILSSVGDVAPSEIARDALPYGMLAVAPFAIRGTRVLADRAFSEFLLITGAVLSAASFVWTWVGHREILPTSGEPFALPSIAFVVAGIAVLATPRPGEAAMSTWRATLAWMLTSIGIVTGTRSLLLLLLVPVFTRALSGRGPSHQRSRRSVRALAVSALLVGAGGAIAFSLAGEAVNTESIERRIRVTLRLVQDAEADQSLQTRLDGLTQATTQFIEEPLAGVGFGERIEAARRQQGGVYASFSADSSLTAAGKTGIAGVVAILIILALVARAATRLVLPEGRAAILAVLAMTVLSIPVRAALTDKGFVLAIALLFAVYTTPAMQSGRRPAGDVMAENHGGRT